MPDTWWHAADDARLWYATSGPVGDVLLLCSGGPGCGDYLGPIAALVDDALHVVRLTNVHDRGSFTMEIGRAHV